MKLQLKYAQSQWRLLGLGLLLSLVVVGNLKTLIADTQAIAAKIGYDNSGSSMTSNNVQGAIDEMVGNLYNVKAVAESNAITLDNTTCPANMGMIEHYNVCIDKTYSNNGFSDVFDSAHNRCVNLGKRLCGANELFAAYKQANLITDTLGDLDNGMQWSSSIVVNNTVTVIDKKGAAFLYNFTGSSENRVRCCQNK